MLNCPLRSLFKASRWLPGGTRKSFTSCAASSMRSLRRAVVWMSAGNERAGRPSQMALVASSLNHLITSHTITTVVTALQSGGTVRGRRRRAARHDACRSFAGVPLKRPARWCFLQRTSPLSLSIKQLLGFSDSNYELGGRSFERFASRIHPSGCGTRTRAA
jgi:hypothetical protein